MKFFIQQLVTLLTSWAFIIFLLVIIFRDKISELCSSFEKFDKLSINKEGFHLSKEEKEMQKRTEDFIKKNDVESTTNVHFTSSDINSIYQKELIIAQLEQMNTQINIKVKQIYDLRYGSTTQQSDFPPVLIFEKLRSDDILSASYCYYIYEFCFISHYLLGKAKSESDYKFELIINDYNVNDLLNIGSQIVNHLTKMADDIINEYSNNLE